MRDKRRLDNTGILPSRSGDTDLVRSPDGVTDCYHNQSRNTCERSHQSWLSSVVLSILWTETAERFAYFGFRAILILYLNSSLKYSESTSIALYAYMTSLAYLTPLLGALLADGPWGFYRTILWFGMIYAVGLMMITSGAYMASSADVPITATNATVMDNNNIIPASSSSSSSSSLPSSLRSEVSWQQEILSFAGLLLACLGTGGIKPCVSTFGANQVSAQQLATTGRSDYPVVETTFAVNEDPTADVTLHPPRLMDRNSQVQAFFAYFYFCINLGAVLSIATIPLVRQYFGFTAAFGIPTVFMCLAVILFWHRRDEYVHMSPSNALASTLTQCCRLVRERWLFFGDSDNNFVALTTWPRWIATSLPFITRLESYRTTQLTTSRLGRPIAVPTVDNDDLDEIKYNDEINQRTGGESGLCRVHSSSSETNNDSALCSDLRIHSTDTDDLIQDAEQVLRVLPIMAMFPIYWMLYDQQGSVWTLQAARMNLHGLQPEQLTLVNPIEIMIFIPLCQQVIYPTLRRAYGWTLLPFSRIQMGMLFAAWSFALSAVVEINIQQNDRMNVKPPSVFLQLMQITLLAISEILVSVTGLEWAYDSAPDRVKALIMALFLLTTAIGDFMGGILYSTIFRNMNRATILAICTVLLLLNRYLFDWVIRHVAIAEQPPSKQAEDDVTSYDIDNDDGVEDHHHHSLKPKSILNENNMSSVGCIRNDEANSSGCHRRISGLELTSMHNSIL